MNESDGELKAMESPEEEEEDKKVEEEKEETN